METHFFMTRDDSLEFISFMIELVQAEFVPEKSLFPPPFPRYTTLEEVQKRMDEDVYYSRFFVLSSRWERLPLVFHEIDANDGQHFFVVAQETGRPAFDFIPASTHSEGDVRWMISGSFTDYPYYIEDQEFLKNRSLYRTFRRPEEMTNAHKGIQKYVRRNGVRSTCRETGHTGPWIISGAMKEYEAGIWLRAGNFHFEPKGKVNNRSE